MNLKFTEICLELFNLLEFREPESEPQRPQVATVVTQSISQP